MGWTPEKQREYNRRYYEANRVKLLEYQHRYNKEHREKIAARTRAYRDANRDRILERKRAAYAEKRAEILPARRAKKMENPEKERSQQRAWYSANKERIRAERYGLTVAELRTLLARGRCDLCGDSSGRLVIDHSRATGMVRGLLCDACNIALGKFRDDPETVERAAKYLRAHHAALREPRSQVR